MASMGEVSMNQVFGACRVTDTFLHLGFAGISEKAIVDVSRVREFRVLDVFINFYSVDGLKCISVSDRDGVQLIEGEPRRL